MDKLIDILRMRRQHGSTGEFEFTEQFIAPLAPEVMLNDKDEIIAYVVRVGKHNGILWSCHIDTVHHKNPDVVEQDVYLAPDGMMFVTEQADCLGADDGAGVWLLLEMIEAGKAGTYIFHRGEEIGCWGSKQMVQFHRGFLGSFTHAIAFDRRGTTSIITHQRSQRACSDVLGNTLIKLLGMSHELDPTGVYTDTAEYMDIIPECVNVSIGYESEHSDFETLDTTYLFALRDAMLMVEWGGDDAVLPVERDPSKQEFREYDFRGWNAYKHNFKGAFDKDEMPELDALMHCSMSDIEDWCDRADATNVAWLIADLVDQIADLKATMYGDENDGDPYGHLNVGMH